MNTYFIPHEAGPTDSGRRIMLESLVGEDAATFSPREQAAVDYALDHGELYWATIDHSATQTHAESDMGDPDSAVRLIVPRGTSNRRLLEALDAAIQVLLRVDTE